MLNSQLKHTIGIAIGILLSIALWVYASYSRPQIYTNTATIRILSNQDNVFNTIKNKQLQTNETIIKQQNYTIDYQIQLPETTGLYQTYGYIQILPDSMGTQIIWSLEINTRYNLIQRWMGKTIIDKQTILLKERLQAIKFAVESNQAASNLPLPQPAQQTL